MNGGKKTIYAFMNAYTHGKSGADIAFIETFKRIKDYHLVVVTSALGQTLCEEKGLRADYLITTKETYFSSVIKTYIKRMFLALILPIQPDKGDVLYATSDALPDTLPIFVLKLKYPYVRWVQKIFHINSPDRVISALTQKLSFLLIQKSECIILANEKLFRYLKKNVFTNKKLYVNHLGIDPSFFAKIKPIAKTHDAVFIGRLHKSKGIFDLIEIWKHVITNLPDLKLTIIGKGDHKIEQNLKDKITQENLEKNIELVGYKDDIEAFSIIKSGKIFVFPSHEEGFSLTILEVFACEIPVVAYDLPAYKKTFQFALKTVKRNNFFTFANEICTIINSREKAKKLVDKEKSIVDKFTWDKTADKERTFLV